VCQYQHRKRKQLSAFGGLNQKQAMAAAAAAASAASAQHGMAPKKKKENSVSGMYGEEEK